MPTANGAKPGGRVRGIGGAEQRRTMAAAKARSWQQNALLMISGISASSAREGASATALLVTWRRGSGSVALSSAWRQQCCLHRTGLPGRRAHRRNNSACMTSAADRRRKETWRLEGGVAARATRGIASSARAGASRCPRARVSASLTARQRHAICILAAPSPARRPPW